MSELQIAAVGILIVFTVLLLLSEIVRLTGWLVATGQRQMPKKDPVDKDDMAIIAAVLKELGTESSAVTIRRLPKEE